MNCFRPSTVIPLRSTPLTVGKRGSSLQDEMGQVRSGRGRRKGEDLGANGDERANNQQKVNTAEAISTTRKTEENTPSVHVSLLDEPGEFPLGQHGVVEVESRVLPDVRLPEAQGIDDPVELLIPIMVLRGSERMGHALQAVYYGTGEVIGWVDAGKKEEKNK